MLALITATTPLLPLRTTTKVTFPTTIMTSFHLRTTTTTTICCSNKEKKIDHVRRKDLRRFLQEDKPMDNKKGFISNPKFLKKLLISKSDDDEDRLQALVEYDGKGGEDGSEFSSESNKGKKQESKIQEEIREAKEMKIQEKIREEKEMRRQKELALVEAKAKVEAKLKKMLRPKPMWTPPPPPPENSGGVCRKKYPKGLGSGSMKSVWKKGIWEVKELLPKLLS